MSDTQHADTSAPSTHTPNPLASDGSERFNAGNQTARCACTNHGFAIALGVLIAAALVTLAVLMAMNANDAFGWATIAVPVVLAVVFRVLERRAMSPAVIGIVIALVALSCVLRFIRIPIQGLQFTSWLVIVAGLALGAEPGFLAGALVPFISNFWLGQGSWTPWEMLAWGLLGAIAGWINGTHFSRNRWWMLVAGVCSGWVYGFILNMYSFLYMRTWNQGMFWSTIAAGLPGDTLSGVCTGILLFASIPWSIDLVRRVRVRNAAASDEHDATLPHAERK